MSSKAQYVKFWRKRTKQRMVEAFGSQCAICGYSKCISALEFHHLDPSQKEFGFGAARASSSSWQKMCDELKKCVMLCSNCHKEYHAGLTEIPDDSPRFDEFYYDYKAVEREKQFDECPICKTKKLKHQKTCSLSCAGKIRHKIDWDSIDLQSLKAQGMSNVAIGEMFGVSDVAVIKRLKRLGLYDKFRVKHARPNKTIRHRAKSIRKKAVV